MKMNSIVSEAINGIKILSENIPDGGHIRASAVILIPAILHNDYEGINPFSISDSLMEDEHDLVQKGYGWMLKSLSQVDSESVKDYLILNHVQMPRTAYRYALEKFDKETRKELMNL